ncbi:type III secretion protein [Ralstonia solanacearum]|nr:type III secretion protein [Ralstonia solanacearum]BEU71870.1 flagellar biosynthesis protein FlhB [Ralstonia pseudosolanacearum]AXV90806.1 type III secretion protein [Ralstonia solanacearum]AXW20580.1 type III secretion protein [Ralstonia solanacearum]AXW63408.1 type III secretion protein [Ralstonia solanacearum]
MADQDMDKSQPATPYKLQKAREKGQVAKSRDVISAGTFTVAMVFLTWQGWETWRRVFQINRAILAHAGNVDATEPAMWHLVDQLVRATLELSIPFLLALLLAAVAGNLLQTGAILSFEPIKPEWDRANPVQGFKRLFSIRTLFDGARALLKLILLGLVAYFSLKSLTPQFYHLASLPASGLVHTLLDDLASLGLKMSAMLMFIALLDLIYTRREFSKKMRMSHKELKDEFKHREGDPRIRSRLRKLRHEMLKRSRSLSKTRDADVLITNPTHVAVALRYVHGEMESPQLVAKGAGALAAVMRKIAAKHHIPVVQNRALARALFHSLEVDRSVPPALYADVARIIVWVFAMRRAREKAMAGRMA